MRRSQFNALMEEVWSDIRQLNLQKGKDYAGDDDALRNFKVNAERNGLTKYQVWGVYAGKHWDAVSSFIRNGQVESEPIEARINDLLVYLLLLRGLIEEDKDFCSCKAVQAHGQPWEMHRDPKCPQHGDDFE